MTIIDKLLACLGFASKPNNIDENIGKIFYIEGLAYLGVKDLENAMTRFLSAANMGYPLAYYLVAGYYTKSPNKKDRSRAFHYYSKGRSSKGFPDEFHRLGALFYLGELPGNYFEKIELYCKCVALILTDKQMLKPKELYCLGMY